MYADVSTDGRNVGRSNAPATFPFLVDNRFRVNAKVINEAFGKVVRVLDGFLLGIAHVSVCLVEVALHRFSLIIA